ncbi:MAG: hypothetical protein AAF125_27570, partial [Chloroflexota bacterium]
PEGPLYALVEEYVCPSVEEAMVVERNEGVNERVFCETPSGQRRAMTDPVFIWTGVGFTVLLFLGIIFTIMGTARAQQNMVTQVVTSHVLTREGTGHEIAQAYHLIGELPPEAQAVLERVVTATMTAEAVSRTPSLSERLTQLEEARVSGLISQSEYDRVREAILDRMDD